MKKSKIIFSLACAALLAACGQQTESSSSSLESSETSSSIESSYSYSSSQSHDSSVSSYSPSYSSSMPSISSMESSESGASKEEIAPFKERVQFMLDNVRTMNTFSYAKTTYLRGGANATEQESIDYRYCLMKDGSTMLYGDASMTKGKGLPDDYVITEDLYGYEVECYEEDGFLLYAEKTDGTAKRVSYLESAKASRYNNVYNLWNTSHHISMAEDIIEVIEKRYSNWYGPYSDYEISSPYLTQNGDVITLNLFAYRPDTGYYAGTDFFRINCNVNSGELISFQYGFSVFDEDYDPADPEYYISYRVDTISNLTYGGRGNFTGNLYHEEDVDKIYGQSRFHSVDYSSWEDGRLTDEHAKEILGNIEYFAMGTSSSTMEANIPQFIDAHDSIDDSGNYKINGTLDIHSSSKLYADDTMVTIGTMDYVDNDPKHTRSDVPFTRQTQCYDEGVIVIDAFDDLLEGHKHTYTSKQINDLDLLNGVSPVYNNDMKKPFNVMGHIGLDCPDYTYDGDDENNYYTCTGTINKTGKTLEASVHFYWHNVWTPYYTFDFTFKIENGFLSEFAFTVETFISTDEAEFDLDAKTYVFTMSREDKEASYPGELLNPDDFEESVDAWGNEIYVTREGFYIF